MHLITIVRNVMTLLYEWINGTGVQRPRFISFRQSRGKFVRHESLTASVSSVICLFRVDGGLLKGHAQHITWWGIEIIPEPHISKVHPSGGHVKIQFFTDTINLHGNIIQWFAFFDPLTLDATVQNINLFYYEHPEKCIFYLLIIM